MNRSLQGRQARLLLLFLSRDASYFCSTSARLQPDRALFADGDGGRREDEMTGVSFYRCVFPYEACVYGTCVM